MDSSAGEPIIDALEGQRLGRYEIVERIGRGGMAVVYRALQPTLRRHVAIKVLPPYLAHEPGFLDRFQREAETVARLDHPNILPIYDFGREGDLPYIVMPLVTGGTLRDWMSEPVPLMRALQAYRRILAALEYAHTREPAIIHRDIKPSNILISQGDWPLLTDFGIAKIAESPLRLTGSATIIGTPEYMAPEQSRGSMLDHRADVYGMGVLLFELLTGEVPFEGESALDIILRHLTDPVPRPSEVRPELGTIWDEIVQRSMAKEPSGRYPTALALEQAVEAATRQANLAETGDHLVGRVNLPELHDSAARALAAGHYSRVISLCGQILALDPAHLEAGRLLTEAQAGLLRQRAEEQVAQARELVRQGDAALAAEEYPTAREQFRAALRLAPGLVEAESGLHRLENILAELYQAARTDLAGGRWTDAAARLEQLAAVAPDDRGLATLREQLAAETERQARIAAWYDHGGRAAARQDWAGAQAAYRQVVESAPGYRDAAARLAAAEQALAAGAGAAAPAPPGTGPPPPAAPAPPAAQPPAPAAPPSPAAEPPAVPSSPAVPPPAAPFPAAGDALAAGLSPAITPPATPLPAAPSPAVTPPIASSPTPAPPAAVAPPAAPPAAAVAPPAAAPVAARVPTAARVYVTNRLGGTVTVIDAVRQAVVATMAVGAGPLGIAAAPDGRRVYVANRGSNRLQVLEAASQTVLANVPISAGPYSVAVHPDGSRVYVTSHFGDSLVVVDAASQRVVATIRVGRKPTGVAVASDGRRAYVACRDGNSVAVVDVEQQAVVATIALPPRSSPEGVAVAPDHSRVYVTALDGGALVALDPANAAVAGRVAVGSSPHGVAVHPDGRIYVTTADSVVVVDASPPTVAATIAVERWPRGIAIAPDGGRVYVAHRDSGNVQVLDAATHALVGVLPAGAGAVGVAVARA